MNARLVFRASAVQPQHTVGDERRNNQPKRSKRNNRINDYRTGSSRAAKYSGNEVEIKQEENDKEYAVFYSDSEELAKALALDHMHNDVTTSQVVIERPRIKAKQFFGGILFPLLITLSIIMFVFFDRCYPWWALVLTLIFVVVLFIKRFVILLILIYQKIAPKTLRSSCRFEPSCSNYMLQAIEKYGFLKGFVKGLRRLLRCHYPNGGVDYP